MILGRISKGERIEKFETLRQRKDGTQILMSLTISPIRDEAGNIVGASKIGRDVSDLRQSQERQILLLREMNHRIKNLFAVAGGVVALSARAAVSTEEMAADILSRLSALSRAHELILPANDRRSVGTSLKNLIEAVLRPYQGNDNRITMEGPDISCGANSTESFALLFHEFATNSVKYGALSSESGRIHISWTVTERLELVWRENVPLYLAAEDEGSNGFGSFLVVATMRSLDGTFDRRRIEDDFIVSLSLPLERLAN